MHVFLTGGTGLIGSAVTAELLSHGHSVRGLARSASSASALEAAGAEPLLGGLGDLDVLRDGAARADGVIHLAFSSPLSCGAGSLGATPAHSTRSLESSGRTSSSTSDTLAKPG